MAASSCAFTPTSTQVGASAKPWRRRDAGVREGDGDSSADGKGWGRIARTASHLFTSCFAIPTPPTLLPGPACGTTSHETILRSLRSSRFVSGVGALAGKSKGFAHVHFPDEASLDGAMALDGAYLKGRRIKVSYGQPKQAAAAAAE